MSSRSSVPTTLLARLLVEGWTLSQVWRPVLVENSVPPSHGRRTLPSWMRELNDGHWLITAVLPAHLARLGPGLPGL